MAYRVNRVYFSNVSNGLWLAVWVVSINQQYPVASFSKSQDNFLNSRNHILIPGRKNAKKNAKGLLMKLKEESEKTGLELKFQKTKIMASGPITSWQIDGETMETVTVFIFLGSKITADEGSHKIKRCLFLGRKAMTNLDSIFKSRDIISPTKICLVKAMGFPVVMYGCKGWTIKKAES